MRILYFMDGLFKGGKERRLIHLLRFVVDRHVAEVELAVMSREIAYPEFYTLNIKTNYLIRKGKKDLRIFRDLYRLCRTFQPDIIHTWDSMTAVYAAPVAKLVGAKHVNGLITDAPENLERLSTLYLRSKFTFALSDLIVSNSIAGLRAYKAPLSRSVCIYNGFDFRRIKRLPDPQLVKQELHIETQRVVGMVGAFADRKDYDTYILAAQKVLATRGDVTFLAVGEGKDLERCKSLVNPEYRNRVRFLGWQEGVETIMNAIDIGVLSAYREGISNSILEFMALGKPIVATDSGGTKEIVVDGETGFLFPVGDSDRLASRIIELLCDQVKLTSFGEKGRERVLSLFGIETMGNQFMHQYQRLIKNGENS